MTKRSESTRLALLEAALQVIARDGVQGVTHRRVAAAAGISLSSTSYHFSGLDEMLLAAFEYYVTRISEKYSEAFERATTHEQIADATLALIRAQHDDVVDAVLLYEWVAQAVRDARYRAILHRWSRTAKAKVEQLYGSSRAVKLEALWEGLTIQRFVGDTHMSDEQARAFILEILESHT
jgi:TetR/AcrR family transcriptional regulator, regulator of biofilm formation and stress response